MTSLNARILIVDDEPMLRRTMSDRMKFWDCETEEASSGEEALEKLGRKSYDLVLLDLKMPGLGGMEVMKTMRERNDLTDVVVLTAHGTVEGAVACLKDGGKILLCGNGGSAADAQHIACELAGRFNMERAGLTAMSLTTNSSTLTAVANDYGFRQVFARQVEAMGSPGDLLVAISTSGSSPNILDALDKAREHGLATAGLSGKGGGDMVDLCDICVIVPSDDTPRIQEAHITIGHAICDFVERALFGD